MTRYHRIRRIDLRTIATRVICTDPTGPRGMHMTRLLGTLGMPFEFIEPVTLRRDPTVLPRATDLALNAAKLLFQNRERLPLLVLEDDCDVSETFAPQLDVPADADVAYLGSSIWGLEPKIMANGFIGAPLMRDHGPGYLRIYNMLQTHAVLFLTPLAVQRMTFAVLDAVFTRKPHDVPMARQQRRLVSVTPRKPIFFQSDALQSEKRRGKLKQEQNSRYALKAPAIFSPHLEVHLEDGVRRLVVVHDSEGHPHWEEVDRFPDAEPPDGPPRPFRIRVWRENHGKFIRCAEVKDPPAG